MLDLYGKWLNEHQNNNSEINKAFEELTTNKFSAVRKFCNKSNKPRLACITTKNANLSHLILLSKKYRIDFYHPVEFQQFKISANLYGHRILYIISNTKDCAPILTLFQYYPGVAWLKDFGLNQAFETSRELEEALYESHGYQWLFHKENWQLYPANFSILSNALGVIFTSKNDVDQLKKWYGEEILKTLDWCYQDEYEDHIEQWINLGHQRRRCYLKKCLSEVEEALDVLTIIELNQMIEKEYPSSLQQKRFLYDITSLVKNNSKTSEMTQKYFKECSNKAPKYYRFEPVYRINGDEKKNLEGVYYHARTFFMNLFGKSAFFNDSPLEKRTSDVLLTIPEKRADH